MRNLVSTYVEQFRQDRQKQLKLAAVLAALAVLVAGLVFWQLHSTGVAMTNEVFCGQEEHIHDDGCYEQVLICGSGDEDHVHDDSCYETVLTCQIPEHTHTVECLMDETADVETADVWKTTLPELTDVWSDDVVAIAESQVGYTESTSNFVLADDGETHMGYTRYGAWYGNAYGDWDAMFASFCLNYANVPSGVVAENSGAYALAVSLNEQGLYIDSADFTPAAGDLVFFSENENETIDRVGIIAIVSEDELTVIEGNSEDAVAENIYDINDSDIVAFGILPDQGTPEGIETADGNILYAANDGGVYVSVTAPAGAIPEGALLSATLLDENSEDYASAADAVGLNVQTLSADNGGTGMAVLDICFLLDGLEVEPAKPVTVSIDAGAILPDGADNIMIRHLEETEEGVVPVLMAELTVEEPVAEFEVESFSSFTITWGTGDSATEITVYVYDMNGIGIYDSDEQGEGEEYTWSAGVHTIENLLQEHVTGKIADGYTYAYATVQYLTTSDQGGTVTTIGSADDPVVSVSWNGTSYVVTTEYGSTTTVTKTDTVAAEFYINLYFSTPTVSISVTGADTTDHTVSLTAETEYFQDSSITYEWEIIGDGESYAAITDSGADATVNWDGNVEPGTTVTVRVTATSETGETAIATYELAYGMQQVTYTVYYGTTGTSGTIASGAHVAIYDNEGNLVSNGEADENGQVTLWIVPGTTYALEASYTISSGTGIQMTYTHYSYEDENYVFIGDGTDNTNIYMTASDANFYEHVDIKLSIADVDSDAYSDILANVDYVRIYDEEGELVYQSSQLVHNEGTSDYNVLFADADGNEGDNPHSIAFYDTYSIEIAYEISYTYTYTNPDGSTDTREYTETYIATIDKNSTYMTGEYYSYSGTNAYQLYNEMYETDYDAASFAAAVAASEAGEQGGLEYYNEKGIDISGQTYFFVAAALCDTKDMTNQAGLDLALGTSLRLYSSTTWRFDVEKTLKNAGAEEGSFIFELYEADVEETSDDDEGVTWTINISDTEDSGLLFTLQNEEMILEDGSSFSVDKIDGYYSFNYDSSMVGVTQTYYFVLLERTGSEDHISYDTAVYGIKVEVTLNSSTDMTDVTITETAYNLTEQSGSGESYRIFTQGAELDNTDDDGNTIYPFENDYDEGSYPVDILKYTGEVNGTVTVETNETYYLWRDDGNGNLQRAVRFEYSGNDYSNIEWGTTSATGGGAITVSRSPIELTFEGLESGYTYYLTTSSTGDTSTGYTPVDLTYGNGLDGAEFILSKTVTETDDEGTETEKTYYAYFQYVSEDDSEDYDKDTYVFIDWAETLNDEEILGEGYTFTLTSGSDGYIHIDEIDAGTYTLTETKAPDGYIQLTNSITVSVNEENTETDTGAVLIAVENTAGSELPNTGGIGTWIYTVTGLLLIGGAASLIVYRKRRVVES